MSSKVAWCCLGFSVNYGKPTDRALGIEYRDEEHIFYMVSRSVQVEDQEKLRAAALSFPISVVLEMRIRNCPWCGKDLASYYGRKLANVRHGPTSLGEV